MKKHISCHRLTIAASVIAMLGLFAPARAEPVVPAATSIKAEETAILLVDFQANFVSPEGAWYGKFKEHYAKKWVSFAYQREGHPDDACTVAQLAAKMTTSGYTVLNLLADLTQTLSFRVRAVDP